MTNKNKKLIFDNFKILRKTNHNLPLIYFHTYVILIIHHFCLIGGKITLKLFF
jgi:hypothetical protein